MSLVTGVQLKPAYPEPGVDTLSRNAHRIDGVVVIEVPPDIPLACRRTHTAGDRAEQSLPIH